MLCLKMQHADSILAILPSSPDIYHFPVLSESQFARLLTLRFCQFGPPFLDIHRYVLIRLPSNSIPLADLGLNPYPFYLTQIRIPGSI